MNKLERFILYWTFASMLALGAVSLKVARNHANGLRALNEKIKNVRMELDPEAKSREQRSKPYQVRP